MTTASARLKELLSRLPLRGLARVGQLRSLAGAVQRAVIIPGRGLTAVEVPDGVVLEATATVEAANTCAFNAVLIGDVLQLASGGLVGGVMPSNTFGSYASGPSTGYGTLSNFGLTAGWNYLVAEVTATDGRITAVTLALNSTSPPAIVPTEGTPPTAFEVPLWAVHYSASDTSYLYRLRGCSNVICRPRRIFSRVDPGAGCAYPLIHTWTWEVV